MKRFSNSITNDANNGRVLPVLCVQAILLISTLISLRHMSSNLKTSMGIKPNRNLHLSDQNFHEFRANTLLRDDRQCGIAVVLGSGLNGERSQFALINSIISNYVDSSRVLCIFSFATEQDYYGHANNIHCVFDNIPLNVRIIIKKIDNPETWSPTIFAENGNGRADLDSVYNWFRWYLKPEDVHGLTKVLWLDNDIIVQGNIAELYDWDLRGNVVAAGTYGQPMRQTLCFHGSKGWNPELHKISMTYHGKQMRPQHLPHHMSAGVLLIDLEQYRKKGILKEWNRLLKQHQKLCMWKQSNQPPFTLAIRNEYEELPEVWNIGCLGCVSNLRTYEGDACNDGRILHWNGSMKPWDSKKYEDPETGKYEESGCRDKWLQYDILGQSKSICVA